jgi:hypothetical protein
MSKGRSVRGCARAKQHWRWVVLCGLSIGCSQGVRGSEQQGEQQPSTGAEQPAQRVTCGKVQCEPGQVCCNPSCGTCSAPQGLCTQQFCDDRPPGLKAGEPPPELPPLGCESLHCAADTHCELVQVQCVRAPCEPIPQCRPGKSSAP